MIVSKKFYRLFIFALPFLLIGSSCFASPKSAQLIDACHANNIDEVQRLLRENPDINVNAATNDKVTPLYIACQEGNTDIVELLLNHKNSHEKIDVNAATNDKATPLYIACQKGNTAVVKLLLNHEKIDVNAAINDKTTPLYIACAKGNTDVVELLLNHKNSHEKIAVNAADNNDVTPLYVVCQEGNTNVVELLLNHKNIDVNAAAHNDATPLYVACQAGNIDVVRLLLNHKNTHKKIDVNAAANDGETPLHTACEQGNTTIVKLLLEHGANPFIQDATGKTAQENIPSGKSHKKLRNTVNGYISAHHAAKEGNLEQLQSIATSNKQALTTAHEKTGLYPIHYAAQENHRHIVEFLCNHNRDQLNVQDTKNGKTPFHLALKHQCNDVIAFFMEQPDIDISKLDSSGHTPLHYAITTNNTQVITWAIDKNLLTPEVQMTLLDDALHNNQIDSALLLVEHIPTIEYLAHYVAQKNMLDALKVLLEQHEGTTTTLTRYGYTLLHTALQAHADDVVDYLITQHKELIHTPDQEGYTPLHLAAQEGKIEYIQSLCDQGANIMCTTQTGLTPIHCAALNDHTDIVELLSDKLPPHERYQQLHIAALNKNMNLLQTIMSPEIVWSQPEHIAADDHARTLANLMGVQSLVNTLQKMTESMTKKDATPFTTAYLQSILPLCALHAALTQKYIMSPSELPARRASAESPIGQKYSQLTSPTKNSDGSYVERETDRAWHIHDERHGVTHTIYKHTLPENYHRVLQTDQISAMQRTENIKQWFADDTEAAFDEQGYYDQNNARSTIYRYFTREVIVENHSFADVVDTFLREHALIERREQNQQLVMTLPGRLSYTNGTQRNGEFEYVIEINENSYKCFHRFFKPCSYASLAQKYNLTPQ